MKTDPTQPAFPALHIHHFQGVDADGKHENVVPRWMGGLTKREFFAVIALHGLLSHETSRRLPDVVADVSVDYADALIAALNASEEP